MNLIKSLDRVETIAVECGAELFFLLHTVEYIKKYSQDYLQIEAVEIYKDYLAERTKSFDVEESIRAGKKLKAISRLQSAEVGVPLAHHLSAYRQDRLGTYNHRDSKLLSGFRNKIAHYQRFFYLDHTEDVLNSIEESMVDAYTYLERISDIPITRLAYCESYVLET